MYQDEKISCVDTNAFNQKDCAASDLHKTDYGGDRSALRYKVYYPKKTVHDYDNVPLPAIIIFHAGGFGECSDYDDGGNENDILNLMAMEYAKKGFICILAHYRTGRLKDEIDDEKISTQQMLAVYRAIQDVKGCIRSIVKRDAINGHGNANGSGGYRFKINTDQVFIGGLSAGSIAALSASFYRTQTMANQVFLSKSNSDFNIEEALGNIKANNYYYAADSSQYNINIRGVLNCWGGIVFPKEYDGAPEQYEEYEFFQGGGNFANPPTIGFAGGRDRVIWYSDEPEQDFRFSTQPLYKKEKFCLFQDGDFKIKTVDDEEPALVKQGSAFNLYHILEDLDRFTELYEDSDARHGLDSLANYGFTVYNKNTIVKYIVQRSAVFFQTIMSWQLSNPSSFPSFGYRGDSYFKDCKNNRICTDITSNHDLCP